MKTWKLKLLTTGLALNFAIAPVSVSAQSFAPGSVETGVSGNSSSRTLIAPTLDNFGLNGVESQERSDEPCFVRTLREDLANSGTDGTRASNRCGGNGPTSSTMKVEFTDGHWAGTHVFVRAIRVCLNANRDKVKGFGIKGSVVDANGTVMTLEQFDAANPPGPNAFNRLFEATDERTNCDDSGGWRAFVECPAGHIATGLVAHFATGNEPRRLTGVALICRQVQN